MQSASPNRGHRSPSMGSGEIHGSPVLEADVQIVSMNRKLKFTALDSARLFASPAQDPMLDPPRQTLMTGVYDN